MMQGVVEWAEKHKPRRGVFGANDRDDFYNIAQKMITTCGVGNVFRSSPKFSVWLWRPELLIDKKEVANKTKGENLKLREEEMFE